jgi:hypothetical protein
MEYKKLITIKNNYEFINTKYLHLYPLNDYIKSSLIHSQYYCNHQVFLLMILDFHIESKLFEHVNILEQPK